MKKLSVVAADAAGWSVVVIIIALVLFVAGLVIKGFIPLEAGKCYRLTNEDPFKEKDIIVKVIEVDGRYAKYQFLMDSGDYSTPTSGRPSRLFYDEIECPE